MSSAFLNVLNEIIHSGWTYVFIGLWLTIGGSRLGDGFEAVLGVILVLYGALALDRKAKKIEEQLEKLAQRKD